MLSAVGLSSGRPKASRASNKPAIKTVERTTFILKPHWTYRRPKKMGYTRFKYFSATWLLPAVTALLRPKLFHLKRMPNNRPQLLKRTNHPTSQRLGQSIPRRCSLRRSGHHTPPRHISRQLIQQRIP